MTEQQQADALLYWVNTFPLDSPIKSLKQLNDGYALAKVLADIDPSFKATDLRDVGKNPGNWVTRWDNLKLVNKGLSRYTRDECYAAAGLALTQNLKRIAEDADEEELCDLLSVLLIASVTGPKNATYIEKIQHSEHAATFAAIIKEKRDEDSAAADAIRGLPPREQTNPTSQSVDIDLAVEEKYGELIAKNSVLEKDNRRFKEQNADLLTRLDRLVELNEDLKTRYFASEDKTTELSNRLELSSPEVIKHMEERIREQDITIGTQEKQIEDDGNTKSTLQRELGALRNAADENKEFKFQVEELKHENEELLKKANAMERYKQKLESQKHLEPENSRLKEEAAELSQERDKLQKRVEHYEATHSKYQKTLQNSEIELFELRNQKNTIEFENRQLQQEVLLLKEREELDLAMITELQEKMAGNGSPSNIESPVKYTGMNLQAEMDEAEPGPNLELEVNRLRHQNELLKGGANAMQEKFDLEIKLTDANRIRETVEKKHQILFEEHVLLQKQLSEIIQGRTKEGAELDKSYKDLSTRLATEAQETKRKMEKLEVELGEKDRELLAVQADLSMVDNEEIEQIEILKSTNSTILSNLKADYERLQARYQALSDESIIQKSQLTEALLSKDKVRQERDDFASRVSTETAQSEAGVSEKAKEKEEHIKTQSAQIKELQDRLKNSADGAKGNEIKTEKDEIIMNLKRENTLVATAWYDLTTRIQSNNVVLQRRSDAPKSWINKHRQAAFGAMPRR